MEKRGEVRPELTPDVEGRLVPKEKRAGVADTERQIEALDDDFSKRAAAAAGPRPKFASKDRLAAEA